MFSNIIGHNDLRANLCTLVDKPGTFLFYGPPSIGKRTIATEIARYNLCVGKKDDGCECNSCKAFLNGHPDFLSIGSKGKVLVDDVDNLITFNSRAPLISPIRVTVIDSADNTSVEAANRLLKTLEESPFTFILIASDPSKMLPTIVSRCVKMRFNALSAEDISNIMFKKFGFDLMTSRTLGWVGAATSIDIFNNAGTLLKHRDMACDFVLNIRNLLSSLDFIDKIEPSFLSIFSDMLILILTDVLMLKNGINDIVNADKRDILQKVSKVLNDKALVSSLGFLTQVKKNSQFNINLNLAIKSMLIKVNPILCLT